MAFDAGRFMVLSNDARRTEMMTGAASVSSDCVALGSAMGVGVAAETNPVAELLSSMEELSMMFEEKAARKIAERKLGERCSGGLEMKKTLEKWLKVFPDMPGKEKTEEFLRRMKEDPQKFFGELEKECEDPSHRYAILDALESGLEEGDSALRGLVASAKEKLLAEKSAELKAAVNIAGEINSRAACAVEMKAMRALYQSEVIGFTTPQACFRALASARGVDAIGGSIDFLVASCGADIQSPSPSLAPEELRRILLDLQCVQVLSAVLDKLGSVCLRMERAFGEKCSALKASEGVVGFTERPYVLPRDISSFVVSLGLKGHFAKMDFCRELTGVFRMLSPRLFANEDDRIRLVDAAQEYLDELVMSELLMTDVEKGGAV